MRRKEGKRKKQGQKDLNPHRKVLEARMLRYTIPLYVSTSFCLWNLSESNRVSGLGQT